MSSTLSFPCATLPSKAELARAAVAEVREQHGSLTLWLPGVSARGVLVKHADGRLNLRLLACVSDEDYAIAYRCAGALCDGDVEVEGAGPVPAKELAERLADWQLRDRAMAFAALRASLAEGPVELSTFMCTVTLTDPAELDGVIARLCRSRQGDEVAIVVAKDTARVFAGASVRACLANGPAVMVATVEKRLTLAAVLPETERDMVLIDLDAKRMLISGGDALTWAGWEVTHGHDREALAAYLGGRGLAVPREREPDEDPAVEAVVAALALGAEEHLARLRAQDRALPREPQKTKLSYTTYLAILAFLVCLPLRLVALPFRGAAKRARQRRIDAFYANARAKLAVLAAAATNGDRMDRALYLEALHYRAIADRELCACLERDPDNATILYNRGVVRADPCPVLSRRDLDAARAKGYRPPKHRDWRGLLYFFVGI